MDGTAVSFNATSIQTANIGIERIQHQSIPAKDAQALALAHGNMSIVPFENSPHKIITLIGKIEGTAGSISDCESRIDSFKALLTAKLCNLDIGWAGGTRRYTAITVTGCDIDQPGGLAHANFTVTILCQPFGTPTSATVANNETSQTGATDTFTHTYLGSAEWQLPVITLTINSGTGLNGYVKFTNHANGQGITIINQTFVAADVVVIDSKLRKVTKNGVEIDYLGSFPEFNVGAGQMDYADGFTTRNINTNISYYPLYL